MRATSKLPTETAKILHCFFTRTCAPPLWKRFFHHWLRWVAEPVSKLGGTSARQKNYRNFLWFELATVMSQAMKYDVIIHTPYEGLNYTIFDKITPLWKRIDEPPEIQIGCYRGEPGQQHHSDSSYNLFWLNKTVRRLHHWNFHLLSFRLALSLLCDLGYVTINEKFTW